jgi:hypothetical protein
VLVVRGRSGPWLDDRAGTPARGVAAPLPVPPGAEPAGADAAGAVGCDAGCEAVWEAGSDATGADPPLVAGAVGDVAALVGALGVGAVELGAALDGGALDRVGAGLLEGVAGAWLVGVVDAVDAVEAEGAWVWRRTLSAGWSAPPRPRNK